MFQLAKESSSSYYEVFQRKGSGKRKQAAKEIASNNTGEEAEAQGPRGGECELNTQFPDTERNCIPLNKVLNMK